MRRSKRTESSEKTRNAPGQGRPALPWQQKKQRLVLYIEPGLSAYLEAAEQPATSRASVARRRKREAADLLAKSEIESRIL